jgi:hypothetical protein
VNELDRVAMGYLEVKIPKNEANTKAEFLACDVYLFDNLLKRSWNRMNTTR